MDEIGKIVKNNFKIYADTLEASGHEIKAEQLLVAIDRELREVSNRFERLVIKKNAEYIICSAIYFDNKKKTYAHQPNNIESGYVICGHRHHNCFMTMSILDPHNKSERMERPIQGFLTNTNRFVDRAEGFEIALKAEQILTNKDREIRRLFSEDIY